MPTNNSNKINQSIFSNYQQLALCLLLAFSLLSLLASAKAHAIVSITLNPRQLCDLELLLNEGFAPLQGFMDQQNYETVVDEMRLADGTVWPIPIVLDIDEQILQNIGQDREVNLRDAEGFILAKLMIASIWKPHKEIEAQKVYGTTDEAHPGVNYLLNHTGSYYIGGKLSRMMLPKHYDFNQLRHTPAQLKKIFQEKGYTKIVAFQTRNPMHRAHLELTLRAASEQEAHLLLHPVVGLTKPGDVDYFTRVKCYRKLLSYFPADSTTLSLLPLAMRMAGPREALWHAIIRKNYGCTHFIVGRDHAGPGQDKQGKIFYDPYAAQELVEKYAEEIGIKLVPFKEMVYVAEDADYQQIDAVSSEKTILSLSGTALRQMLREGTEIPAWFSFPEVIKELKKVYPAKDKQGFTLFFTGLSGAGKSTLANAVAVKLMEIQERSVTLLDGDIIRQNLSAGLGFSKEHRSINVKRVGFVASEITKNRGIALCAMIAPYEQDRRANRELISQLGKYIEIYVATPLAHCEIRDTKGLYQLARQGKLSSFTGIDDPYECPLSAEIVMDTSYMSIDEGVDHILTYLAQQGYLDSTYLTKRAEF